MRNSCKIPLLKMKPAVKAEIQSVNLLPSMVPHYLPYHHGNTIFNKNLFYYIAYFRDTDIIFVSLCFFLQLQQVIAVSRP